MPCIEVANTLKISVIIPTRDPDTDTLIRVADALARQTLPVDQWEVVLVDNASLPPVSLDPFKALAAPVRRVEEGVPGLSRARSKGIAEARGPLLVFIDDDVLPAPDFLESACTLFARLPTLGTAGGGIVPEFEVPPPDWFEEFSGLLALRPAPPVEHILSHLPTHPASSPAHDSTQAALSRTFDLPTWLPNGAGLIVRREAAEAWVARQRNHKTGPEITDRVGSSLASGGDQDIVLAALRAGWHTGCFPTLLVRHIIPTARLQPAYLCRLNHGIQRSWVHVLHRYGLNPWNPVPRYSASLRKARAFVRCAAWKSPSHRIRWRGLCGRIDGLADIAPFSGNAQIHR